jgi:hypothetical protein
MFVLPRPDDGATGGDAGGGDDGQGRAPDDRSQGSTDDRGAGSAGGDDLQKQIAEANREAAGYRRRLREMEGKLKEFEDRDKSETEKLQGERDTLAKALAEAEADRRALRVHAQVTRLSSKRLVEDRPWLTGGGGSNSGGGGNGASSGGQPANPARRSSAAESDDDKNLSPEQRMARYYERQAAGTT